MNKRDEITDGVHARLRSNGGQPAQLHGLAKVHKKDTRLRTVLFPPVSSYDKLNKTLAKHFDKIEDADIETNTEAARNMIENTKLDFEDNNISLVVKILYTNVPLKHAIDIARKKLYSHNEPPDLSGSTIKRLFYMVFSSVHFKCNKTWYVQKDGLATGASLAVILANLD